MRPRRPWRGRNFVGRIGESAWLPFLKFRRTQGDSRNGRIHPDARNLIIGQLQGEIHPRQQRSEEHTSELQSLRHLVCRLLLEKKHKTYVNYALRADWDPELVELGSWLVT